MFISTCTYSSQQTVRVHLEWWIASSCPTLSVIHSTSCEWKSPLIGTLCGLHNISEILFTCFSTVINIYTRFHMSVPALSYSVCTICRETIASLQTKISGTA